MCKAKTIKVPELPSIITLMQIDITACTRESPALHKYLHMPPISLCISG